MWEIKKFRSQAALDKFVSKNKHKLWIEETFINNGYAVFIKPLKIIDIK